jgi:outer membrane PBP1 activator LpoA protein
MKNANLILICLLVTGCASDNAAGHGYARDATINHLRQKDFSHAKELENLSRATSNPHVADTLLLDASESYINADANDKAIEILQKNLNHPLTMEQENRKHILFAKAALTKGNSAIARKQLKNVWTPNKLSAKLQKEFYQTRAAINQLDSDTPEAAKDLVTLSKLLTTANEVAENNQKIVQTLSQLTPQALAELSAEDVDDKVLAGWIEFIKISKQYDYTLEQTERAHLVWQQKFANHPANLLIVNKPSEHENEQLSLEEQQWLNKIKDSKSLDLNNIASLKYKDSIHAKAPRKIAIILPLHGKYAPSAKAVRDGFLAAHFESASKPKIQVYDSADKNIVEIYKQALAEGAEFIVGPLMKQEIDALSTISELYVPVLALNESNDRQHKNLFQFGLSPEDEAIAVANKAWLDGRRLALVIYPQSEWGNRVRKAFETRWHSIGGRLIDTLGIDADAEGNTLNANIKTILHVGDSEKRAQQLKKLGIKFNFQAKRRRDIDMVFIATNADAARQVKPLLNYHFANDLPAYATSSIFPGKSQNARDQDLNGIVFCDMPWILDKTVMSKASYKSVSNLWPQEFEKYMRLYALGMDAHKIALQLNNVKRSATLGISGMTGMLKINSNNNKIYRELMWAEFKHGEPALQGQGKSINGNQKST